jgi:hyperosmotically inducible protein
MRIARVIRVFGHGQILAGYIGMTLYSTVRRCVRVGLFVACASIAAGAHAQQPTAPDNTKVNARDRKPSAVTADQQKNNKADLETTRQIRKALMADKSLSTYAHNVKVVTRDGKVTLKGPVRSEDEKHTVVSKAAEVAGATNVTDQLSVAPAKATKTSATKPSKTKQSE